MFKYVVVLFLKDGSVKKDVCYANSFSNAEYQYLDQYYDVEECTAYGEDFANKYLSNYLDCLETYN